MQSSVIRRAPFRGDRFTLSERPSSSVPTVGAREPSKFGRLARGRRRASNCRRTGVAWHQTAKVVQKLSSLCRLELFRFATIQALGQHRRLPGANLFRPRPAQSDTSSRPLAWSPHSDSTNSTMRKPRSTKRFVPIGADYRFVSDCLRPADNNWGPHAAQQLADELQLFCLPAKRGTCAHV